MTRSKRHSRPLSNVFAWPLAIFLLGLGGLVIALTGDGWRDATAWVAVGVPVAVVAWAMRGGGS